MWGLALREPAGPSPQREIILVADGKVYPDSNGILGYADAHMPEGMPPLFAVGADDLCHPELRKLFDDGLGPAARRVVYGYLLEDTDVACRVLASAGSPLERQIARTTFPLLRAAIRRGLKVDQAGVERSRKVIERVFATVEERIKDGRPYLLGDSFTAADLSFASLAAPLLFPAGYVKFSLPLAEGPPALVPIVEAYRNTIAGRFAMSLYDRERDVTPSATKGAAA